MTVKIGVGDTVHARGRTWTAVTAPEGDVDMLVADPHFKDEERVRIARVSEVNEKKRAAIPHGVYIQRDVLDLSEVECVESAH